MDIAQQYAKALFEMSKEPSSHERASVENLKRMLERRGHLKLLPRIASEYQKLLVHDKRLRAHRHVTPQQERTRVLLELYRKLVSSK